VLAVILATSCGASDSKLGRLETQQQEQVRRLERIRREIADAERQRDKARRDAEYEECRSTIARFQALVELRNAECAENLAAYNQCLARQDARKAKEQRSVASLA
jgi:uncharacterized protein with von Willebrand factor type A (vWA) domain